MHDCVEAMVRRGEGGGRHDDHRGVPGPCGVGRLSIYVSLLCLFRVCATNRLYVAATVHMCKTHSIFFIIIYGVAG